MEPLGSPPLWEYYVCECKKVTAGSGKGRGGTKPPLTVGQGALVPDKAVSEACQLLGKMLQLHGAEQAGDMDWFDTCGGAFMFPMI